MDDLLKTFDRIRLAFDRFAAAFEKQPKQSDYTLTN
jgi:hypothetical protein